MNVTVPEMIHNKNMGTKYSGFVITVRNNKIVHILCAHQFGKP